MPHPIAIKIDVTKIDKARLFKGAKGTYLDAALFPYKDGTDRYGNDYMVTQSVSKEDREAGVRGPIIGNARIIERKAQAAQPKPAPPTNPAEDDVPF